MFLPPLLQFFLILLLLAMKRRRLKHKDDGLYLFLNNEFDRLFLVNAKNTSDRQIDFYRSGIFLLYLCELFVYVVHLAVRAER